MLIKIFGSGCVKCKETENIVEAAVQEAGSSATVEKVTDFGEMMAFGVMSTLAVVIDSKVMCTGRTPSKAEVRDWLSKFKA